MVTIKYPCSLLALAGILFTSSCDKNEPLTKKRAGLETELKLGSEEMQTLDAELAQGSKNIDLNLLSQQHVEWVKYNATLEQALAGLKEKCSQGDELLKKVHTRLDAYKALNAK